MSYRTILVCLNDLDRNAALLEGAAGLARDHGAHLQGLYVVPAIEIYAGVGFEPVVFEDRHNAFRKAEWSLRKSFESTLENFGIRGDFEAVESASPDICAHVIDRVRRCDIAVINQPTDNHDLFAVDRNFAERVILSAGRPTIVVPRTGDTKLVPDLAIVGWSGTREAARAAFDSVPILKKARSVRVVSIDPDKTHPYVRGAPESELATGLSRHGINTTFEPIVSGGEEAGSILLKMATDSHAGLLVMGAYGHSRLSELILGGATRSVLAGMKCPVIFSH